MYGTAPMVKSWAKRRDEVIKEWFFTHGEDLYQWLIYSTGKRDIEPLMIEIFLLAIKKFHHYQGDMSPHLWLIALARQRMKYWKRYEKASSSISPQTLELPDDAFEMLLDLQRLQPIYKEVFILTCIMEFTIEETAIVLNTNSSKVERLLQRGMGYLRNLHPHIDISEYSERFPKPVLFDDQRNHIYEALQRELQQYEIRAKKRKRIRWTAILTLLGAIFLLTAFLSVTETGRQIAWNVWLKLNRNIVTLEDGVIAKYGDHLITEADFELVERNSGFESRLSTLMIYEEALAKGYEPDMQQVEEALSNLRGIYQNDEYAQTSMFEVMQRANLSAEEYWENKQKWLMIDNVVSQYYIDLFGTPYFPEAPLPTRDSYIRTYVEEVHAFMQKQLLEKSDQVILNKSYDFEFNWRKWQDQWKWPSDVILMYWNKPVLTVNTPRFDHNISETELQNLIGYELLYFEAIDNYYQVTSGEIDRVIEEMREKFTLDPEYRQQVLHEMDQQNITEEQYWRDMKEIVRKEIAIDKYIRSLYPDTYRMNVEQYRRVIEMVSLEKFHLTKELLSFNERYLHKYKWDLEKIKHLPEQIKHNLIAVTYDDFPFIAGILQDRFRRSVYEDGLLYAILADLAKEHGYSPDEDVVNQYMQLFYEELLTNDYFRIGISDAMRLADLSLDELRSMVQREAEGKATISKLLSSSNPEDQDMRSYILEILLLSSIEEQINRLKMDYPQYWQKVRYNPDFPFSD